MAPQLKVLNKGPGKQRFVFKSFAQRVEDVDIDVFKSLAPVKFEPSSGSSSFFHENLLRWRELNAAADFNSLYLELIPIVQNFPQLLLHKDAIMKALLSRVHLGAILSLEPILSLIALLSRDLREEFLPYIAKFLAACSDLLKAGADQEPDVLEQIFVSISYVIKYLATFLSKDVLFVLRVTKSLRYYDRTFVQDFIAESVSYLLRKAPPKQLIQGIRRLFAEVESDPTDTSMSSCCTVLFHILKGPASGLHSQAESLLHLLLDKSTLTGGQKKSHGKSVSMQVLSKTFLMLCEHTSREKLATLWDCLMYHIAGELLVGSNHGHPLSDADSIAQEYTATVVADKSEDECDGRETKVIPSGEKTVHIVGDKSLSYADGPGPPKGLTEASDIQLKEPELKNEQLHLVYLLSLLTDILEFRKGSRVNDYKPLFSLVPSLIQKPILFDEQLEVLHISDGPLAPARLFQDWDLNFTSEVLRFLLALVRSHAQVAGASAGPGSIATIASTWARVFECSRVNCLFPFLRGLVELDAFLLQIFVTDILRCLDRLVDDYPVDVLSILLDIIQKQEPLPLLLSTLDISNIKSFIVRLIEESMRGFKIESVQQTIAVSGDLLKTQVTDPAMVWVALRCLPSIVGRVEESASLAWQYGVAVESFLVSEELASSEESENILVWECLLATALSSHMESLIKGDCQIPVQLVQKYLDLAIRHKQSSHVLKAAGDLLDALPKGTAQERSSATFFTLLEDLGLNLSVPNKSLRIATLRVLANYELLQRLEIDVDQSFSKWIKGNGGQAIKAKVTSSFELFQELFTVESSAFSHENVRQSIIVITAIKVTACGTSIPDSYVVPLVNALLGVLHNRFSLLWEPVMEALAGMLAAHWDTVGQVLLSHLEATQNAFLCQGTTDRTDEVTDDFASAPRDLWAQFHSFLHENTDSTQTGTFFVLQLKILQKVASFSEARSRQLIPLFLKFVSNSDSPQEGHEVFVGGGKSWKAALKEWLNLIKEMRNARSLFKGPLVKEILLDHFLSDTDPAIQEVTLEVLLNWKDNYLTAHEEHLRNLISSKAVREELTTWDISRESHLIQSEDRSQLVTTVLLLLFPKIMRRTAKSMGKSGVGAQRNAVLSFLARLEPRELAPLFFELMKPLQTAFAHDHPPSKVHQFSKSAWMTLVEDGVSSEFIEQVDTAAVTALAHKRKLGFLHMVMDSLDIFSSAQLTPYLHALLAVVLRLLEACSVAPEDEASVSVCAVEHLSNACINISNDIIGTAQVQVETNETGPVSSGGGPQSPVEKMPAICCNEIEMLPSLGTLQQLDLHLDDMAVKDAGTYLIEDANDGPDLLQPDLGTEAGVSINVSNSPLLSEKEDVEIGDAVAGPDLIEATTDLPHPDLGSEPELPGNIGELALLSKERFEVEWEPEDDSGLSKNPVMGPPKGKGGGVREIRTLALKILATVMRKFEDVVFSPLYWDIFFAATKLSVVQFVSENRLSSAPGALMQCFMSMSQRADLAPLLSRDPAIIPNIISVFSVKGASAELISAILKFVENILDLVDDGDENSDVQAVRELLTLHMNVILSSFGDCLSLRRGTATERRSLKRELKVLTRLSKYIEHPESAAKLVEVLLPMLKIKKRMEPDIWLEVLHLLHGIGPILQIPSVIKCLPVLGPLLKSVSNRDVREAVSKTLVAFARVDQSLLNVAELLMDLNSMSSDTIDELDYGRRLLAYDRMLASQFLQLTQAQAVLILSHVIYDMGSDDMSLRHRASDCLQKFIQFSVSLPDHIQGKFPMSEKLSNLEEPDELEVKNDLTVGSLAENDRIATVLSKDLKTLVPHFLFPHVRNAMGSDQLVVRREWVLLLREMAANFSDSTALSEYGCLISKDIEADFFYNIVHLQVHRRIKAMAVFKGACSTFHFSQGSLSRIFVPLFMNSLFEAKGDKEGNLVTVAVETVACIAKQLHWEPYFGLLMRCFRMLTSKADHQKVLVRVVCGILDSFHFFHPLSAADSEKGSVVTRSEMPEDAEEEICKTLPSVDNAEGEPGGGESLVAQLPVELVSLLQKRVLPEIRRLMVSKVGIVSTPVALTQVKILKLMPEDIVEVELPQVVRTVVNALKSRSQAVRDEARTALLAITETLGANYLHFVVDVLRSSLMRGFEMHVLGYTLNSVLVRLIPTLMVGEIDYCLGQLLEVLENDIMGEVAEEKDVEAIAVKMKETKHMRSFESMKLVAQVVTFRTQAIALLGPVRRNLHKATQPKVKAKLKNILQHIALGLQHNKSVSQGDLLVTVYAMVDDGVKEEKIMALAAAAKKQARISSSISSQGVSEVPAKVPVPNFYLITEYALQLLHSHLKRVKVNARDEDTMAMLNPLVGLLQECLNSKYDGVLASALKIFSQILLLPLPAIDLHGSKITSLVFSICQQFSKADNPLLQACLNVLIILIRQCKTLRLSEDQLRALLQFPIFTDMEGGSRMALSLLKAIVSRKLLVPELYDMMNRVSQLMVTSHMALVRQLCSQILLQFLLDYPLGKKRLQQQLDFFIMNTGYSEKSGREAALEMLHTVILKFHHAIVEEHTESLFFPLVTRLVNDESNQVRSMVGTILKVLMAKASPRSLQRMVDFAVAWFNGEDTRLWRTAAQVLGFLIEVMGTGFGRYSQDVFSRCTNILELESRPHAVEVVECDETAKAGAWQDAYYSLTMMEKLLQQLPSLILLPDLKTFWMSVSSLLLHQHIWIRKVCGRLLGIYLASCGEPNCQTLESAAGGDGDILFFHPSWILLLVASLCKQLDSGSIDDAMGEQLVKILEVMSIMLPLLPQSVPKEKFSFLGCSGGENQGRVVVALQLLGWEDPSQKGSLMGKEGKTSPVLGEQTNGQYSPKLDSEGTSSAALALVFKKVQKIALRVYPIQTKVILRWYSAMAPRLGPHDMEQNLQSMLIVLTKLTEGSASKVVPEDVKLLGDEVLNELRELLGTARFVNIYNAVRETGKENRERRKRAHKISVLVDPEQNAKSKIKMSAKRQAQKKRKIVSTKRQMGL